MRARRAESSRRLIVLALVASLSSRRRRELPSDDSRSSLSLSFARVFRARAQAPLAVN
jgi:hypothetical protein